MIIPTMVITRRVVNITRLKRKASSPSWFLLRIRFTLITLIAQKNDDHNSAKCDIFQKPYLEASGRRLAPTIMLVTVPKSAAGIMPSGPHGGMYIKRVL